MSCETKIVTTADELRICLRLRWTVFVEEQGVPPSMEVDEHDREPSTVHVLGFADGVAAGAGRMVPIDDGARAQIGRMAVVDDAREKGLGKLLLLALEGEARRRGALAVTLSAQVQAQEFYRRLGYAARGKVFDDAGIPHIEMQKAL